MRISASSRQRAKLRVAEGNHGKLGEIVTSRNCQRQASDPEIPTIPMHFSPLPRSQLPPAISLANAIRIARPLFSVIFGGSPRQETKKAGSAHMADPAGDFSHDFRSGGRMLARAALADHELSKLRYQRYSTRAVKPSKVIMPLKLSERSVKLLAFTASIHSLVRTTLNHMLYM